MRKSDRIQLAVEQTKLKFGNARIVGSGLTKRTVVDVCAADWIDMLENRQPTTEQLSVLGEALWPAPLDGLARLKSWADEQLDRGKHETPYEVDSREWFASLVIEQLEELKRLVAAGQPIPVLSVALSLGTLAERIKWKFQHEEAALTGYARRVSERNRQVAGVEANEKKSVLRRNAIRRTRDQILTEQPELRGARKDSAIAREILQMASRDACLRTQLAWSNASPVGEDAIRSQLRALRSERD